MEPTDPAPKRRPRFSLLSLLLLTLSVASFCFAWVSNLATQHLRKEIGVLEGQIASLSILAGKIPADFSGQLYVQRVPVQPRITPDSHRWEWVLNVPASSSPVAVCYAEGPIPATGFPSADAERQLTAGRHTIANEVYYGRLHAFDSSPRDWRLELRIDKSTLWSATKPTGLLSNVRRQDGNYSEAGVVTGSDLHGPLELIRYREPGGDRRGFMIWLEPR